MTFHILIGKFPYFIIRFYYKAIKLKTDKLIEKLQIGKKVITGGLGYSKKVILAA